ncbi:hypothetical protein [Desulfamplus magnetovallimortis]|uniref:hypothetical protein n=1 Tax=Desulfamplus magnetovallimortis TaxID=1246637 RepID=UPI001117BD59|nr:hypothetical protein [Desulfamplus magnetovallimortis]
MKKITENNNKRSENFKAVIEESPIILNFVSGILTSTLISFIEIYSSNHRLASTINLLNQESYTVVPYGKALLSLYDPFSALAGSLFFAFTAGLLITISSIVWLIMCRFICNSPLHKRKIIFLLPWLILTVLLYFDNESAATSTLFIPLAILFITKIDFYASNNRISRIIFKQTFITVSQKKPLKIECNFQFMLLFFITIFITTTTYYLKCDKSVFIRARDYILLDNKAGATLNEFYYKHTLYAAEAIKKPMHKQVKTCWIDPQIAFFPKIKKALSRHGWFSIQQKEKASLHVEKHLSNNRKLNSNEILLIHNHDLSFWDDDLLNHYTFLYLIMTKTFNSIHLKLPIFTSCQYAFKHSTSTPISIEKFIEKPSFFLDRFSQTTDTHAVMRILCFVGLITTTPLLMLFISFLFIAAAIDKSIASALNVLKPSAITSHAGNISLYISSALTVSIFLGTLTILYPLKNEKTDITMAKLIIHKNEIFRIEALRRLYSQNRQDIKKQMDVYEKSTIFTDNEQTNAEKYWLAKNMGKAGVIKNIPYLEKMSYDTSINVQCSTIEAIAHIIKRELKTKTKSCTKNQAHKHYSGLWLSKFLEKKIITSHDWYVQWYAYQSLNKIRNW